MEQKIKRLMHWVELLNKVQCWMVEHGYWEDFYRDLRKGYK